MVYAGMEARDTPQTVLLSGLKSLEPMLRQEGVSGLSVFGSRARGDHHEKSDVDLLIDVSKEARFSILNIVGVEQIVFERLAIPASVFMRRSLDIAFSHSIAQDEIKVF